LLASQVKIDFRPAPYIFIRNYNDNKNYAYNQKNQDTFLCEKILSLKARGGEIRPLLLLKRPVGQSLPAGTAEITAGNRPRRVGNSAPQIIIVAVGQCVLVKIIARLIGGTHHIIRYLIIVHQLA